MDYTGGNPSNDHTCCIVWSSITPVIRWAQNSTAFPPIMFLNKKHRHHCDTDLSKKKGTLDVLTFDHIFSAKGQKDPVACLSCLARSWCEQKGYNKQKQGKYSLQTYIRSYNIYIYNAYIMHIPPTKWDVSKFLGPKKSRKKKKLNVFEILVRAQLEWWTPQNFGVQPKSKSIFSSPKGQTPTTQTRKLRETWDSSFQWDPTSWGRHLEGQMKPWNSSQLVWNSLVFESPLPGIPGLV